METTQKIRAFRLHPGTRLDYIPSMTFNPDTSDRGYEPRTSTVVTVEWLNPVLIEVRLTNGKVLRLHPQEDVITRSTTEETPMVGLHYHDGNKERGISLD